MRLRFTKMHCLGDDFVVIDGISQKVRLSADKVRTLADRSFGIGCNKLLLVEVPSNPEVDFSYRIFNADGAEISSDSSGARCFARFVRDRRLTGKNVIRAQTASGIAQLSVDEQDNVSVDMGVPRLQPADIPFKADNRAVVYPLTVGDHQISISVVSMGSPHAVYVVDAVDTAEVTRLGPLIESHPRFPQRVNASFMQVVNSQAIKLRLYQRTTDAALGHDANACAAVVAGRLRGILEQQVEVDLPGGQLSIHWAGEGQPVILTGPASNVFHGQVKI